MEDVVEDDTAEEAQVVDTVLVVLARNVAAPPEGSWRR